ncbi:MAG: methyltransferase domain-containing protein [Spirochaetia bacterium]|nr:methyltransferase domain-containing protein [Spirochaetia bacterium]
MKGGTTVKKAVKTDLKITAEPYRKFAEFYDVFMNHVPFEVWARYLISVAVEIQGRIPPSICDLACGTGKILSSIQPFVRNIYGLDGNAKMLSMAEKKLPGGKFVKGRLEGPFPYRKSQFQWVICTHDSLNYLISSDQLQSHFFEVGKILKSGGIYSTDIVTLQNIIKNFDRKTRTHTVKGTKFKWSNRYDRVTKIMTSRLEFYINHEIFIEEHLQRYYSVQEVVKAAEKAGLELYLIQGDYQSSRKSRGEVLTNLHFIKR